MWLKKGHRNGAAHGTGTSNISGGSVNLNLNELKLRSAVRLPTGLDSSALVIVLTSTLALSPACCTPVASQAKLHSISMTTSARAIYRCSANKQQRCNVRSG